MTKSAFSVRSPWRSPAISALLGLPGPVYLFVLAYSIALACLLTYQSLWVDEIMQVLGTRSGTLEHTEQLTRTGVGGVPLGWLPQLFAIYLFGYSTAAARLPSALAGVGSCLTVFLTARELGLRYPLVPAILLSVLPLQFRYALEGRPYAQGVLLSAVATLVFIQLIKYQSIVWFVAYAFILVLGIYSQPFTSFTAFAHFVWTVIWTRRQNRLAYFAGGALVVMALTFLPWYVYASPLWQQTIRSGGWHLQLTWKTPLMLIREITGAGYLGGAILLFLVSVGFRKASISAGMKWLLVACSVVPVICVLAVDAAFSYFLAIRQMIFILPPLILLAADGLSALMHSIQRRVVVATALLAVVFICADVGWLKRPREDWGLAARAIEQLGRAHSACMLYAPRNSLPYYSLFEPRLENSVCGSSSLANGSVLLAISPYATETDRGSAQQLVEGKHLVATQPVGMTTIQIFQ